MPCADSTSGTELQSVQAMQCVRFVVGGGRLGYAVVKPASWLVTNASNWLGVARAQPVLTCAATSKPRPV